MCSFVAGFRPQYSISPVQLTLKPESAFSPMASLHSLLGRVKPAFGARRSALAVACSRPAGCAFGFGAKASPAIEHRRASAYHNVSNSTGFTNEAAVCAIDRLKTASGDRNSSTSHTGQLYGRDPSSGSGSVSSSWPWAWLPGPQRSDSVATLGSQDEGDRTTRVPTAVLSRLLSRVAAVETNVKEVQHDNCLLRTQLNDCRVRIIELERLAAHDSDSSDEDDDDDDGWPSSASESDSDSDDEKEALADRVLELESRLEDLELEAEELREDFVTDAQLADALQELREDLEAKIEEEAAGEGSEVDDDEEAADRIARLEERVLELEQATDDSCDEERNLEEAFEGIAKADARVRKLKQRVAKLEAKLED